MRISSHWFIRGLLSLFLAGLFLVWRGAHAKSGSISDRGLNSPDQPIPLAEKQSGYRPAQSNSTLSQNTYIFLPLINRNKIQAQKGVWTSKAELAKLPTSGSAWKQLKAAADETSLYPDLSDRGGETNIVILAKALVYARTGEDKYRSQVRAALKIIASQNTEDGGNILPVGRNLVAYVVAADLIELPNYDAALDLQFRNKLRELLDKNVDGDSLQSTHETRANNFGTHAGASRAAVAVYLGDDSELERTAKVFRGWLGDRSAYSGFNYSDDLSWQCDPTKPVGVNPSGCVKGGRDIDGAIPEEMRRGGSFQWPPLETGYPWGGLQGAVVQAAILHRAGYPAWEWEDQALLRAVQFLYEIGWQAEGDDEWQIWLINRAYGTSFPAAFPAQPGKNMGFTDWTHAP
jgi:hypothetical protein